MSLLDCIKENYLSRWVRCMRMSENERKEIDDRYKFLIQAREDVRKMLHSGRKQIAVEIKEDVKEFFQGNREPYLSNFTNNNRYPIDVVCFITKPVRKYKKDPHLIGKVGLPFEIFHNFYIFLDIQADAVLQGEKPSIVLDEANYQRALDCRKPHEHIPNFPLWREKIENKIRAIAKLYS